MDNSEFKVAVIGAGGIARQVHLPSLHQMPDVRVVSICDIIESCRTRARPETDIHDAVQTMKLVEMIAADAI